MASTFIGSTSVSSSGSKQFAIDFKRTRTQGWKFCEEHHLPLNLTALVCRLVANGTQWHLRRGKEVQDVSCTELNALACMGGLVNA